MHRLDVADGESRPGADVDDPRLVEEREVSPEALETAEDGTVNTRRVPSSIAAASAATAAAR